MTQSLYAHMNKIKIKKKKTGALSAAWNIFAIIVSIIPF
jgi:hypothetical protein